MRCTLTHARLTSSWSTAGVRTKTSVAEYHAQLFGFLQSGLHAADLIIDTAYYLIANVYTLVKLQITSHNARSALLNMREFE